MNKISIALLSLVVLIIAACGGQSDTTGTPNIPEPASPPPAAPSPEPEPIPEPTTTTTPVEPTPSEPSPSTADEITVQGKVFSQTEVTISPGTMLTIRIVGGTHILRVNKVGGGNVGGSPTIRDEGKFEFTFTDAGEYEVVDTIGKGRMKIHVA